MDASKVTIGAKTYDLNYVNKTKKTALRRKLVVEYIQSKPAGEYIKMSEFQTVGRFKGTGNTHMFIKRMIRDGIIAQYDGNRPKTHYYAVLGAVRTIKPPLAPEVPLEAPKAAQAPEMTLTAAVEHLKSLGVKFTLTITNGDDNA